MSLYEITDGGLEKHPAAAFASLGIREREDLQRLLREHIAAIDPDLLVIAEEFGQWEDARRRVDLLAIDRDGQLVVIELKRTDDGGHMELQALRYAAMVSAMDFEHVVETYSQHLGGSGLGDAGVNARQVLSEWIGADETDDAPAIASEVRIILVSQDFGREITTAVLWLNDLYGLDIRCIRLTPYTVDQRVLLDVRQVIPLPEAQEYQVRLRRKEQRQERALREGRDYTRYHVVVNGHEQPSTNKRRSVLAMAQALVSQGVPTLEVMGMFSGRHVVVLPGAVAGRAQIEHGLRNAGKASDRFFVDEPFEGGGSTYVLSTQWGRGTHVMLERLSHAFPESGVAFREADD